MATTTATLLASRTSSFEASVKLASHMRPTPKVQQAGPAYFSPPADDPRNLFKMKHSFS
jgi:hypothetical protein